MLLLMMFVIALADAVAVFVFVPQWWSSVVQFLQQSSIVDAERNSREAMQVRRITFTRYAVLWHLSFRPDNSTISATDTSVN